MNAGALRLAAAAAVVAALCACHATPLPQDSVELQSELARREREFWRDMRMVRARGFVVFDDGAGHRAEFDWRWLASRDTGFELAASTPDGDVMVLGAGHDGVTLWIRPPGRRGARFYRAPDAQALRSAGPDNPALRALFARVIEVASQLGAGEGSTDARSIETDAGEVRLTYSSADGEARLRLRRADGAALALDLESRAPELPVCIAIELRDQRPPPRQDAGAWQGEMQATIAACCGGRAIMSARVRVRELDFPGTAEFTPLAGSARPLAELSSDPVWTRAAQGLRHLQAGDRCSGG